MAENRRSIDTKYWTDPDVEDLSKGATYLFLSLMTFPENNMSGTYEISDKKMQSYTKMTNEELTLSLSELQSKGKILRHKAWLSIKNHIKNQSLNGGMAVSAVKSFCDVPNIVKLWLFFKDNSQELESWFSGFCFNVNKYYEEQRSRYASNIVGKAKKDGELLDRSKVLADLPMVEFTNDQLIKVMTGNLPFKAKELTNYNSMITLIQQLDNSPLSLENMGFDKGYPRVTQQLYNPPMNINNEKEELKGNNEKEELKGNNEYMGGYQTVTNKPKYQTVESLNPLKKSLDDIIKYWNTKENLPKCLYNSFNVPMVSEIKTKLDVFRNGEIEQAIDNFSTYYSKVDPRFRAKNFQNFITKSLDNWFDDCIDLSMFETKEQQPRKYRTAEERRYFTDAIRLGANEPEWLAQKKQECIDSLIAIGEEFIDYDNN